MDTIETHIRDYLQQPHVMQLATVKDGQPWACTVHFVADETLKLYWLSTPERRHSQEVAANPRVAVAIAVQAEPGRPPIGVQVEGDASIITDQVELRRVMALYAAKHNSDQQWVDDVVADVNNHKLYCLTPRLYVLFDKQAKPDGNPRQEWRP